MQSKELKLRVVQEFYNRFGRRPEVIVRAPGRVNLLGAHVDYNEGWVLPAATEQAVWLAAARVDSDSVRILASDFENDESGFRLSALDKRESNSAVTWIDYPRGVAWSLRDEGYDIPPIISLFASDVPIGAGVSSSAAVEVAFLSAWNFLGRLELSSLQMAKLGQKTENRYIGLASGIMDQFASIHGSSKQLVLLDCRTLSYEHIPLPEHWAILVVDSGIRRALATSEYNVRREQCEKAAAILQSYLPAVQTLRDVSPHQFELIAHHLPILLRRRAQHVVEECHRVLKGAALLKEGRVNEFGRLIRHSHISARDLYEVSIAELDVLAATAWQCEGCYGARLTGAGFGGCVVVLADALAVDDIAARLKEVYEQEFDRTPRMFQTRAADGVQLFDR